MLIASHREFLTLLKPIPNYKVLGIDIGKRRTGIAICHSVALFAVPFCTIYIKSINSDAENINFQVNNISGIVREHKINAIVIGLPIQMCGEDSEFTLFVRKLAKQLSESLDININSMIDAQKLCNNKQKHTNFELELKNIELDVIKHDYETIDHITKLNKLNTDVNNSISSLNTIDTDRDNIYMDSNDTSIAKFSIINSANILITLYDERLTSAAASKMLKETGMSRKKMTQVNNEIAASVILNNAMSMMKMI